MILRAQAAMTSRIGFPAAVSLLAKAWMTGLLRMAAKATI